jgi:hypothetical protein
LVKEKAKKKRRKETTKLKDFGLLVGKEVERIERQVSTEILVSVGLTTNV